MITFKINGAKFQIPTEWADVTYSQYVALITLPNSLIEQISLFTGITREILTNAELKNVEKISLALSFLSISPKFEPGPSKIVGPYTPPSDITIETLGQFEKLRELLDRAPKELTTKEDSLLLSDLYLEACAVYIQKIKDGSFDYGKVAVVKEELKNYSCIEVLQTGAFFLFRPMTSSQPTMTRSQSIRLRLKRLIQDFPGFQKTSDSLQRFLESRAK